MIVIGILLSVFQQFVGINVALYYAPRIFESMGAAKDASMLQTIIMGLVNVVFTVVAIMTVDKWGRKPVADYRLYWNGRRYVCYLCTLVQ